MILHIDGDAFFASCEVAVNPRLRGKPVIIGRERGIATAFTYEAKARGVSRGMLMHQIRQLCPDAVILPGNFRLYGIFSERMFAIVRRYTERVEEYSIDECFADFSGLDVRQGRSFFEIMESLADLSQPMFFSSMSSGRQKKGRAGRGFSGVLTDSKQSTAGEPCTSHRVCQEEKLHASRAIGKKKIRLAGCAYR